MYTNAAASYSARALKIVAFSLSTSIAMGRPTPSTVPDTLPPGGGLGGALDLQGAQFSIINGMRTGNVVFDMLIAMLIPLLFKLVFSDGRQLAERLYKLLFGARTPLGNDCIRTISFMSVGSSLMGRESKNQVLQKAITLYLTDRGVPFEKKAQVSRHVCCSLMLVPTPPACTDAPA